VWVNQSSLLQVARLLTLFSSLGQKRITSLMAKEEKWSSHATYNNLFKNSQAVKKWCGLKKPG